MSTGERRLSEMVGIRKQQSVKLAGEDGWDTDRLDDRTAPMWLINFVMVLLGVAILYIAFRYLDPRDPELLRNPWTYAVATPVLLWLLSIALNSWASRLIEKSMQLALLVSVLIHLLLMVYAGNFVIMSRMWSNVMDSLAEQRQQLKRESLQAPQYVQLSVPRPMNERPDYLRLVPTEHQPSELARPDSPALQLARAERSELVTPSPRPAPTVSPHLLEREQAATSPPTPSETARLLSRSELNRSNIRQSSPATFAPAELSPAEPGLSAARAELRRKESRLPVQNPSEMVVETAVRLSSSAVERATPGELENQAPASAASNIARTAPQASLPAAAKSTDPPASLLAMADPPDLAAVDSLAANAERRREARLANPMMRMLPHELVQADASPVMPPPVVPRREDMAGMAAPNSFSNSSSGEMRAALPRSVAGGVTGSAAPSSMPVQGAEALRSQLQADAQQLQAASSATTRRPRAARNAVNPAAETGLPQAPDWSGAPSLSSGLVGKSPSQLSLEDSGTAAAAEFADLMGTRGAIDRAMLGAAAARAERDPARLTSPSTLDGIWQGEQVTELESRAAAILRRESARRGASDALSSSPGELAPAEVDAAAMPGQTGRLSDGLTLRRTEFEPSKQAELSALAGNEGAGLPRAASREAGVPAERSVPAWAMEGAAEEMLGSGVENPPGAPQVAMADRRRRRGNEASPAADSSMMLSLDANPGPGGVTRIAELAGPVLPNRFEPDMDRALREQFEAQRFERPGVGGPLSAGRDLAIPAPAFQQRLDRLRDRRQRNGLQIDPKTEQAIELGLAFLARNQRPDGSWRLQDFDTEVLMRSDTAATGLALLAFQGAGYTHKEEKYAEVVGRALKFLAVHQRPDGDLFIPQDPASNQNAWLYSHAIAALAVCEAYGMTQDEELRPMAQRAIDFMVTSQDKSTGGWRYRPASGSDTSVTGWFMMAFKSGQLAGLSVPADTFRRINGYLDASQVSANERHLYRYNPFAANTPQQRHGLQPTAVMTSVGLLMRLYFDWRRDRPEMIAGAEHLLENLPRNGTRSTSMRDTYYWYYATQVMFHMGGDRWERWHNQLYPLLIDSQVDWGDNAGSWDPYRPTPDLWARYGGRLYVTTMNLLSLEVSYRHLPLYEATAK
jgi:hypothetical protein